jgi:hypothetical protein
MRPNTDRTRAEALFKKEEQARQGKLAMTEYELNREATMQKTARLRALRLEREAKQAGEAR